MFREWVLVAGEFRFHESFIPLDEGGLVWLSCIKAFFLLTNLVFEGLWASMGKCVVRVMGIMVHLRRYQT